MPERIRLSRARGWRLPEGTVSVARPTRWGNPYIVGQHGTAARCVVLYRFLLLGQLRVSSSPTLAGLEAIRADVLDHIGELRGRNLACWCRLDQPCHADVLLELANGSGQGGSP